MDRHERRSHTELTPLPRRLVLIRPARTFTELSPAVASPLRSCRRTLRACFAAVPVRRGPNRGRRVCARRGGGSSQPDPVAPVVAEVVMHGSVASPAEGRQVAGFVGSAPRARLPVVGSHPILAAAAFAGVTRPIQRRGPGLPPAGLALLHAPPLLPQALPAADPRAVVEGLRAALEGTLPHPPRIPLRSRPG